MIMRPRTLPLRTKTILILAAVLVVCSALLTAIQYRISSRMLAEEWERKAVEYGRLVSIAVQPFLDGKDRPALNRLMAQFTSVWGVKSVTVVNPQGIIIADSSNTGVGAHADPHLDGLRHALERDRSEITWVETHDGGRIRFLLTAIRPSADAAGSERPLQGEVLIGFDLTVLDGLVRAELDSLIFVNVIIFTALLVLGWLAIRVGLIQPLHALAETVRSLPGTPTGQTPATPHDELASLRESFLRLTDALQESDALTRATLQSLPTHAAIVDKDGFLLSVNAAWEQFARDHGDPFPCTGGGLVNFLEACRDPAKGYGDRASEAVAGIRSVLAGMRPAFTLEFAARLPKDRRHFLLTVTALRRQRGGAIVSHFDITEHKQAEDDIRQRAAETQRIAARLDQVYASIPIGLMYVTAGLTIERVSHSWALLHGRSVDDHVGKQLPAVLPPDRWTKIRPIIEQILKTGHAAHGLEETIADPQSTERTRCVLSDFYPDLAPNGTVAGIHIATLDITAEKQILQERERDLKELMAKNRELDQMAIRDPLTGLYNRRFFDEALTREWQQFQRSGEAFTVIIMDVDAFKAINDDFGHEAGDCALQQVAATLKANLRESDLIARVGGDEFAALLTRTDAEQSRQVAEKLTDVLRALGLTTAAGDIPMSLSLGAATVPGFPPVSSAAELLRVADKRMYEAKRLASSRRADAG